eukprot:3662881-Prorocentrum_lima.AAC.1
MLSLSLSTAATTCLLDPIPRISANGNAACCPSVVHFTSVDTMNSDRRTLTVGVADAEAGGASTA